MQASDTSASSSTTKADPMPALSKKQNVKIILLGDSAVGKSKLVERFLMGGYKPQQQSTYALTLFQYKADVEGQEVEIDFWDTAGQERFYNVHPSYYHRANACILVFDTTRKATYKNLEKWYQELRKYREGIPCIVVGNKIDVNPEVTQMQFNFAEKHGLDFYFVSAADGTNVVKVFNEALRLGMQNRDNPDDFTSQIFSMIGEGAD